MNIEIGLLTLERKWYQRVLGDLITKNYRDVVNQKHKHFFFNIIFRESTLYAVGMVFTKIVLQMTVDK